MSLLEVDELRVSFPGKGWRKKPVEVLHGVSLSVAPGETLGLVGNPDPARPPSVARCWGW